MDILQVIYEIDRNFRVAGFEKPAAIILRSHDDGMKLLAEINKEGKPWGIIYEPGRCGRPIEHPDGSIWIELTVHGIPIRWPSEKYAMNGGNDIEYVWG